MSLLPSTPKKRISEGTFFFCFRNPVNSTHSPVDMVKDHPLYIYRLVMGVSKNNGTPKSSILIGFSIINHPFFGTPIFGNIHIFTGLEKTPSQGGWKKDFSHGEAWSVQVSSLKLPAVFLPPNEFVSSGEFTTGRFYTTSPEKNQQGGT